MSTFPSLHKPDVVAAALGCSTWWLKERCRRREIPFVRASNKAIRFTDAHVAEIIRLLEQRPDQQGQQPRGSTTRRSANPPATGQSVTQLRARPPRRTRGT
jgi:hypothetical protein